MSLEKVGTHHNPSDILTKFVQASVLGNHLPKLNLFRDSAVSQVFKVSCIVRVHGLQSHRESQVADQRLSRLHQVCAQHQGQVFMINFEAFQGQQDLVVQRFKSASRRIQRAFTPPPPRRGSENQDSSHSDIQTQIQENQNHVNQNVAATSRWWAFIALIMSIMHFVVQGYPFSVAMFKRVKQFAIMLVNVNQVSVTIIAITNQRRRQGQRRSQTRLSGHTRQSRLQYLCTFILFSHNFSALFATCILIVLHFVSSNQSLSQSSCLTAVSNSVESFHSRLKLSRVLSLSSVASVVSLSCHLHFQNGSIKSADNNRSSSSGGSITSEHDYRSWQVPVIRHALSQVESTQKDQELQRVMEHVIVDVPQGTSVDREEHLLKCLVKSMMADHPQQWDDHNGDIRHFISRFKHYQGDFETLFKVSQGHDRCFLVFVRIRISVLADLRMGQITSNGKWTQGSSG